MEKLWENQGTTWILTYFNYLDVFFAALWRWAIAKTLGSAWGRNLWHIPGCTEMQWDAMRCNEMQWTSMDITSIIVLGVLQYILHIYILYILIILRHLVISLWTCVRQAHLGVADQSPLSPGVANNGKKKWKTVGIEWLRVETRREIRIIYPVDVNCLIKSE